MDFPQRGSPTRRTPLTGSSQRRLAYLRESVVGAALALSDEAAAELDKIGR
jgi:hypothetical protein